METWTKILLLLLAVPAQAAPRIKCDTCESCSAALAKPAARVELSADLAGTGVCLRLVGAGAELNGKGHRVQAPIGLRVEGADSQVRRLRVDSVEAGVQVAAAGVSLLGLELSGGKHGIAAEVAPGLRVVRSVVGATEVGVALGVPAAGVCPPGKAKSSGVVLRDSKISGAGIGVAACTAAPVLLRTEIVGNGVGLLQGAAEGASPTDPCACSPTLPGVKPSTTLLYSSGCGGCKVHEGWLPDVRGRGHDIALRKTGAENKEAMATFDAYIRHCAPEITDAVGIPGCVPNYACIANGQVFKRRGEGKRLIRDHALNSPDAVADFAARCVAAAAEHHGEGEACVKHTLRETILCGNREAMRSARALTGQGNTCDEGPGCAKPCSSTQSAMAASAPAAPAPPKGAPPSTAKQAPKAPTWPWFALIGVLFLGFVGWRVRQS